MNSIFGFNNDIPLNKCFDTVRARAILQASLNGLGTHIVVTNIEMAITDKGIDPDLFDLLDDEPFYIWDKKLGFKQTNCEINKVYEILDWTIEL